MEVDKYIWQRPSPAQLECIVDFFEKNPALNSGYIKTESQRNIRVRAWQKLANRLNNMDGCVKTFKQWLRYWTDKKIHIRKKLSLVTRCQITCDGEGLLLVDPLVNFSNLHRRIIKIMGGERLIKAAKSASELSAHKIIIEQNPRVKEDLLQHNSVEQEHSYFSLNEKDVPDEDVQEPPAYIINRQEIPVQETSTDAPMASPRPASPAASSSDTHESTARRTAASPRNRHRHRPRYKHQASFARLAERFLKLKEERLEVDRRNAHTLETLLEHEMERDKVIAQALQTTAEGLRVLAEALKNKNNHVT